MRLVDAGADTSNSGLRVTSCSVGGKHPGGRQKAVWLTHEVVQTGGWKAVVSEGGDCGGQEDEVSMWS